MREAELTVWRRYTVGSITSDLVAFVRQHAFSRIERILRVGLINGNDRVANEAADMIVSPPEQNIRQVDHQRRDRLTRR